MGDYSDESRRTLYCGNLDEKVTEELLYELFLQAGPLEKVKLVQGKPFAFITFRHEQSVGYTIHLMENIKLFGRSLKLQFRSKPDASPDLQRSYSAPDTNSYWAAPPNLPPDHRRQSRFDSGPEGSPYSDSPFSSPSHSDNDGRRSHRDHHRSDHHRSDHHRREHGSRSNHNNNAYQQQALLQQNVQAQIAQVRALQEAQRQFGVPPMLMGQPQPWQQQQQQPYNNRRRY